MDELLALNQSIKPRSLRHVRRKEAGEDEEEITEMHTKATLTIAGLEIDPFKLKGPYLNYWMIVLAGVSSRKSESIFSCSSQSSKES